MNAEHQENHEKDRSENADPIEKLADKLVGWGLTTPSIIFCESFKPLSFLLGQALRFLEPFLSFAASREDVNRLASALEEREGLEKLVEAIERLSASESR